MSSRKPQGRKTASFARGAYSRALAVANAQRARLPSAALYSLAMDAIAQLSRLPSSTAAPAQGAPSEVDTERFVHALVYGSVHAAADMIETARQAGAALDTLYLDYLGQAARRLGEWWDADRLDFLQVTVAVGRIYAVMRGLRPLPVIEQAEPQRHAVFISMPGDDHHLGVAIAADLFRSRGWEIELVSPVDQEAAVAALRCSDHTVVGISASQPAQLDALVRLVLALHICRPEAFVLVSGSIVETLPDLREVLDADAIAPSALHAIDTLERLIANRRRTRS